MHPHEAIARSEMDATIRGDVEAMFDHYTDDAVLHYPGRNPLSGTYEGKDAIRAWVDKAGELLGEGDAITRTLHDVTASDDHAVSLVTVDITGAEGRLATWNAALVQHFRDGKISEVWITIEDPYTIDELFA